MGTNVDTQLLICDKVPDDGKTFQSLEASTLNAAFQMVSDLLPSRGQVSKSKPKATEVITPRAAGSAPSPRPKPAQQTIAPSQNLPVGYTLRDTPQTNAPVSEIYARYAPQRIEIEGAKPHPTTLVESIAMASVVPPAPDANLTLPSKITDQGLLSDAQLETVIMANDAHAQDLPGWFLLNEDITELTRADDDPDARAYRMGYFLGDGTGCGKGRQVVALILANFLKNRRRAIWVSKSATLIEDSIRDWRDLRQGWHHTLATSP